MESLSCMFSMFSETDSFEDMGCCWVVSCAERWVGMGCNLYGCCYKLCCCPSMILSFIFAPDSDPELSGVRCDTFLHVVPDWELVEPEIFAPSREGDSDSEGLSADPPGHVAANSLCLVAYLSESLLLKIASISIIAFSISHEIVFLI